MVPSKNIKKFNFIPKPDRSEYRQSLAELIAIVESIQLGLENIHRNDVVPVPKKKNIFRRFFSNLKYIWAIMWD